jgi:peptidyl-prolyl cis-trans isomerase D
MLSSIHKALRDSFKNRGEGSGRPLRTFVAWVLFGMIIVAVGFYSFLPEQGGAAGGPAAVVNSSQISQSQLARVFENQRRQDAGMSGDRQNQVMAQILSQMIRGEVMKQAAERKGLLVVDPEVRSRILEMDVFKQDGRFDRVRYQSLLQANGFTESSFEDSIRAEAAQARLGRLHQAGLRGLRLESERREELKALQANASFVRFSSEAVVRPEQVTAKEIEAFLAAPESAEQIKIFFERNAAEFRQPEKAKVQHILIQAPRSDASAVATAREKANSVLKRVKESGADFGRIAREVSDDPGSKANGGLIDFFPRGAMVPEFEKFAFESAPGSLSDLVQTDFGFHIIKVLERRAATQQSLDDARSQIARSLVSQQRSRALTDELTKLLSEGKGGDVERWVKERGLSWEETGNFAVTATSVPKVGAIDQFAQVAFSLTSEKPLATSLVRQGPDAFVVRFAAVRPSKDSAPKGKSAEAGQLADLLDSPDFQRRMSEQARTEEAYRAYQAQLLSQASVRCNPFVLSASGSPATLPQECSPRSARNE